MSDAEEADTRAEAFEHTTDRWVRAIRNLQKTKQSPVPRWCLPALPYRQISQECRSPNLLIGISFAFSGPRTQHTHMKCIPKGARMDRITLWPALCKQSSYAA